MRVIDNETTKEYEIGLFEDSGRKPDIIIRLLELPLTFGKLGADAGVLEVWDGDDGSAFRYKLDSDAVEFFELDYPFEDILSSPQAALKSIICLSPRFRAVCEADKIVA